MKNSEQQIILHQMNSVGIGPVTAFTIDSRCGLAVSVSGAGSVSATVKIEVSDDPEGAWNSDANSTITVQGTVTATDYLQLTEPWRYVRATVTSLSSGAVVSVIAGDELSGGTGIIKPGPFLTATANPVTGGAEITVGGVAVAQFTTTGVSINVALTGGDFASVQGALAAVASLIPETGKGISINVGEGTFNSTSPILIDSGMAAKKIGITGVASAATIQSIQSSSGSAGAWSIVLNMANVTGITAGNVISCVTPTGGVNPTYLAGAFLITNVDSGNSQITITSKHRAAVAPSGAVTGAATILKSVLSFSGCDGIRVWNGASALNISNVAIVGGTTSNGLSIQDLGRLWIGSGVVGVVGFSIGVVCLYNSEVNDGVLVQSAAATNGLQVDSGSVVKCITLISSGNANNGIYATGGFIQSGSATISTGNGNNGFYSSNGGDVVANSTTATGNTNIGYASDSGGWIGCSNATSIGNGTAFQNATIVECDAIDTVAYNHELLRLRNNAAATAGAPQNSPQQLFQGFYWDGSASKQMKAWIQLVDNGSGTNASLDIRIVRAAGGQVRAASFDAFGSMTIPGNLSINTAGLGLKVKEGSNAKQGTATLSAGSVVVANTAVTATSRIFLTSQSDGGTPGFLRVSARTASTSFTITSSSGSDTSIVAYEIFEPG